MRKRHTLYLHPERVKKARDYLQQNMGLSLSAYIDLHLRQLVDVIENNPSPVDKKPSEMTMQEFSEVFNYWLRVASEE